MRTNPGNMCWDCGSTIEDHHTPLCELAPDNAVHDLPQVTGTQWWTETSVGQKYAAGQDVHFNPVTGIVVNSKTGKPGVGAAIIRD